jgi:hypothetical protein
MMIDLIGDVAMRRQFGNEDVKKAKGKILAPFQGAAPVCTVYQGLRSFHSLNPWLFSFTPSA